MYVDFIFIFIFKISILFICFWLCWVSITALGLYLIAASGPALHCGTQSSHSGGFSWCGARALGAWASVVVTHGLSCWATRGVFPDQGWNLCRLHWQMDSYPLRHQGSPDICFLNPHF